MKAFNARQKPAPTSAHLSGLEQMESERLFMCLHFYDRFSSPSKALTDIRTHNNIKYIHSFNFLSHRPYLHVNFLH